MVPHAQLFPQHVLMRFISSMTVARRCHGGGAAKAGNSNALIVIVPALLAAILIAAIDEPKYCSAKSTFVTAFPSANSYFSEYFGNDQDTFGQLPILMAPIAC